MKLNFSLLAKAFDRTVKSFAMTIPVLFGVLSLIALFQSLVSSSMLMTFFCGNSLLDSFVGAVLGSVFAGNPITSYVLGGEFFKAGVSIIAVSAFLVTWVTVGVVQLPAEILLLGKKFAILRNFFSFLSAIIIGICTHFILLIW